MSRRMTDSIMITEPIEQLIPVSLSLVLSPSLAYRLWEVTHTYMHKSRGRVMDGPVMVRRREEEVVNH
jgi:hypothetical protein